MKAKPVSIKKARLTVAATCRSMIIAGRTDGQIWSVLRRVFHIDPAKRSYTTWYRCEVRRRGLTEDRRAEKQPVEKERRHSGYRYSAQ